MTSNNTLTFEGLFGKKKPEELPKQTTELKSQVNSSNSNLKSTYSMYQNLSNYSQNNPNISILTTYKQGNPADPLTQPKSGFAYNNLSKFNKLKSYNFPEVTVDSFLRNNSLKDQYINFCKSGEQIDKSIVTEATRATQAESQPSYRGFSAVPIGVMKSSQTTNDNEDINNKILRNLTKVNINSNSKPNTNSFHTSSVNMNLLNKMNLNFGKSTVAPQVNPEVFISRFIKTYTNEDTNPSFLSYIRQSLSSCTSEEEYARKESFLTNLINSSKPAESKLNRKRANIISNQDLNYMNDEEKIRARKERFSSKAPVSLNNLELDNELILNNEKIIGTSTQLEKEYLRLTSLPDPSQVRPEHILKKSLRMLQSKWKAKGKEIYNYITEQFRSIRQDMTIQNIKNDFTIKVYESHARISLENADLDQFNQCQNQLNVLYRSLDKGNKIEFLAYRILYVSLLKNKIDMENILNDLDNSQKVNPEISHALKVRKALNEYNYFQFFKLYKRTPKYGPYVIEPFLPKLRIKAIQMMCVGYLTELDCSYLARVIGMEIREFYEFSKENSNSYNLDLSLSADKRKFLCKDSLTALNNSKYLQTHYKSKAY